MFTLPPDGDERRFDEMRPLLAFALGLVLLASSQPAQAQSDADRAAAIALFDEARALMDGGDYDAACPKLAEAQRLSPGLGILYNLSNCYEHVGKLASAWASFREVAALAAGGGQSEREEDARARAKALEPRLVRLQVDVSARVAALIVTRNGIRLPEAQWGSAVPVDPGRYVVRAEAPDRAPWQSEVAAEAEGETVKVVVPALAPASRAPRAVSENEPRPAPRAPQVPDEETPLRTWQRPLGIALFAVGAATLVAGGVVAGVAKATADDADCDPDNRCSDDGINDRDRALLMGNVATGLIIGGAVIGATGLVVWLTAPSSADRSAALALGLGSARAQWSW